MAYGNSNAQRSYGNKPAATAPARTAANRTEGTSDTIRISGLYNGKEGSKLVMSGVLKEAVTIPAGHVLKVFVKGGKSKNGKDLPPFELVAQPITEK